MFSRSSENFNKRRFTPTEDRAIIALAKSNAVNDWNIIAKSVETKSARQCRDRWNNYLNPNLNNDEWTPSEDDTLIRKYLENGPQWKAFSMLFKGRSINNVRNRCMKLLRKHQFKNKDINSHKSKSSFHPSENEESKNKCYYSDNETISDIKSNESHNNYDDEPLDDDDVDPTISKNSHCEVFETQNAQNHYHSMHSHPPHSSHGLHFMNDDKPIKIVREGAIDTSMIDALMGKLEEELSPTDLFANFGFSFQDQFGSNENSTLFNGFI